MSQTHTSFCSCFSLYASFSLWRLTFSADFSWCLWKQMPKISYMCSQTKFPTKTVFKIFVNLEMTGHLGAGESLSRAVGRAHSLTNVPLHPDSRLCFQPCLPPLPCKADMAPATLDDSSLTRAVFVSHCALPHSLFLPSECSPPHLTNLYWSFQVNPKPPSWWYFHFLCMYWKWLCVLCILQL